MLLNAEILRKTGLLKCNRIFLINTIVFSKRLLGNYILPFNFCFRVEFVEFILLCFYHYCNRICSSQALHVVHVDGYAKTDVISTFDDFDILDKAIHLHSFFFFFFYKNVLFWS